MIKLINKIYKKDKVTIDIINSLEVVLSDLENKINDLYKQIFLNYATWYLELKEKEMGINKKPEDINIRRNYVKTRLLGTGTATKEMLESVANAIDGVDVEILLEDMTIIINFLKCENNKFLGITKRAIENMIPYHLDLDIKYEHINWGELGKVTWGDVSKYTWGSVYESVAGTIVGGLNDDFD